MKNLKAVSLWISLICFGAILFSSVGVFGKWVYYADTLPHEHLMSYGMGDFEYAPEEVLPGGDSQEAELGGNHYVLVDLILNEDSKGYGLNINNNVILHQYLRKQGVVYSNQKVSGGNLKFIIDPKNNTHELYYCIEKISDTEYYAYTFLSTELEEAERSGSEILVYKTVLIKTDEWRATKSYIGYAKVADLSLLGVSADPNTIPCSIDVKTWHK